MRSDSTWTYFLTDHLESVVVITDSSGALISETRYLPFGETRADVGSITETDYGYTYQQNITGSGLADYNARMYDPSLGRFTQPDSLVPDPTSSIGFNRYAYSNNNPINYTDPSGNVAITISGNDEYEYDEDWANDTIEGHDEETVSNNNDELVTVIVHSAYTVGFPNNDESIDYYSDNLSDPIYYSKNPLVFTIGFLDWVSRFQNLLPRNHESTSNFFLTSQFTFLSNDVLSIDKLVIANYYSGDALYLRRIMVTNGNNKTTYYLGDPKLSHGFGSDYALPMFPVYVNPHWSTTIEITTQCLQCSPFGETWKFYSEITIPSME